MSKRNGRHPKRKNRGGRVSARQRAQTRLERIFNPATAPDRAALLLREQFGDQPLEPAIAVHLAAESDLARARAVAGAALALEPGPGPMALSLAADVALMDGRPEEAEGHAARALDLSDDPELHLRLAIARANQGRIADGIEVLDGVLTENPGLEELQLSRGELLERLAEEPEADRGPLERFRDRRPLLELDDAVAAYVRSSPDREELFAAGIGPWVEAGAVTTEELEDWTERAAADPLAREASLARLVGEWAWLVAPDDEQPCLLEAFAEDPATPAGLARRAGDVLGLALWGLWEVDRPSGAPGVRLTELLSGARVYAELPAHLLEGLPRWSILLGYVAPVDGILRAGSGFFVASPADGRELAHGLLDSLLDGIPELEDADQAAADLLAWAEQTHDELDPLGLPGPVPMPSSDAFAVYQAMVRSLVPELVRWLRELQGTAPEREVPTVLRAELEVADPGAALAALERLPDFEADEEGDLLWKGRPDREEDDPRGTVGVAEDGLLVHVDSAEELEALLGLLDQLGHPAAVRSSETIALDLDDLDELDEDEDEDEEDDNEDEQDDEADEDADLDELGLDGDDFDEDEELDEDEDFDDAPPLPVPDLDLTGVEAWLRGWADLPQPVLQGRTPLEAAEDEPERVEVLVRCLEYELDARGLVSPESEGLRERLGLAAEP